MLLITFAASAGRRRRVTRNCMLCDTTRTGRPNVLASVSRITFAVAWVSVGGTDTTT